ncbi:MAG: sigma 54-interacting transcriptional regulator [Desulfuromonadales bacterium]
MNPADAGDNFLPVVSPDLIISQSASGQSLVRHISARFARWVGIEQEQGKGRLLSRLAPSTRPDLEELVREVLERDTVLKDIRVQFADGRQMLAEISPGGLGQDYRPLVSIVLRSVPAETRQAPEDYGLVGTSTVLCEVCRKISLYSSSDAPVVITGETGTGKELVARALHEESPRSNGPFVAVNCGAIGEELLESELFGHEKGAFTGAVRMHKGRFERADGGTLFLDEIGEMPLHTQARLLRVLESGTVERVGGEQERPLDVRVLAATNIPLEKSVGRRIFRADLYHRLSVLRIHLPPLRERLEDIPLLVDHFLAQFNRRYDRQAQRLTREALELLQSYLWPGNIRELRNVLERVFVENRAEVIGARAFGEWVRERHDFSPGDWDLESARYTSAPPVTPPYPLRSERPLLASPEQAVHDADLMPPAPLTKATRSTRPVKLTERDIRRAWRAADGNLAAAARRLGVHRATLYRYLEKLGLTRADLDT